MPARYPVSSPIASADAATRAVAKGFRSSATATQTVARAETGRKIRAAPMKAMNQILAYPAVSMLNVPVVQRTRPVAMKATLISSGVTRKIF